MIAFALTLFIRGVVLALLRGSLSAISQPCDALCVINCASFRCISHRGRDDPLQVAVARYIYIYVYIYGALPNQMMRTGFAGSRPRFHHAPGKKLATH